MEFPEKKPYFPTRKVEFSSRCPICKAEMDKENFFCCLACYNIAKSKGDVEE